MTKIGNGVQQSVLQFINYVIIPRIFAGKNSGNDDSPGFLKKALSIRTMAVLLTLLRGSYPTSIPAAVLTGGKSSCVLIRTRDSC